MGAARAAREGWIEKFLRRGELPSVTAVSHRRQFARRVRRLAEAGRRGTCFLEEFLLLCVPLYIPANTFRPTALAMKRRRSFQGRRIRLVFTTPRVKNVLRE